MLQNNKLALQTFAIFQRIASFGIAKKYPFSNFIENNQ